MNWKSFTWALPAIMAGTTCGTSPAPGAAPVGTTQGFTSSKPSPLAVPAFRADGTSIAPYLVDLTPTTARIAWRTPEPSAQSLVLFLEGAVVENVTTEASYQHVARFSQLVPNRHYAYSVQGSERVTFHTPPDDGNCSFAILGHTHGTEHVGHYPDGLLAARIAESQPDFVVHAGDCVYYSTPADWAQHFFRLFEELLQRVPVYVSPGNHDSGWPFLNGYDLRCFRELFPVAFPAEVGPGPEQAFYHVAQGPIDFYFLSYVAPMDKESTQGAWLARELKQSDNVFRVVVFGGLNRYYDEAAFFRQFAGMGIDLVIHGDSAAPAEPWSTVQGIRRLSLGTGSKEPHPWVFCHATPDVLTLRTLLADGTARGTYWIHSTKEKLPLLKLENPKVFPGTNEVRYAFECPQPLPSTTVGGLQFKIAGVKEGTGICYASFRPTKVLGGGEFGLRSTYVSYATNDSLITIASLPEAPIENAPYEIGAVELRFLGTSKVLPSSVDAWLFAR